MRPAGVDWLGMAASGACRYPPRAFKMSAKKAAAKKAAAKKGQGAVNIPPYVRKTIKFALGPGRSAILMVAVVGLFFGVWRGVWKKVGEDVLAKEPYWLTADRVEITPKPSWIQSDIRAEVFRDASLDGPLSLLDEDLVERIAQAFSLHAWVAEVRGVRKKHPGGVAVDLAYRRPVCMVQVPDGLYAVDAEGVVLPSGDFSRVEVRMYPRLAGVDTVPTGTVGTRWRDVRVVEGAEIAAVLGPAWSRLELDQIYPLAETGPQGDSEYTYLLTTRSGTRIRWGRAPGRERAGELSAVQKVARLKNYQELNGTLKGFRQLDIGNVDSWPRSANNPEAATGQSAPPARF